MSLETLPPEIWAIIIGKLDTKSVSNFYESCTYFKDLIVMPGVVNRCQFSMNTLATIESFELDFFKDISEHLKVLTLSGMPNLDKSSLLPYLPALKKLTHLLDLDVSFTKIIMPDFVDIVKILPTLKSLSINFFFGNSYKLTQNDLPVYQKAFEGLEKVHFVGSQTDLLFGKVALCILKKAHLLGYKVTIHGKDYQINDLDDGASWDSLALTNLQEFQMYFLADTMGVSLLQLPLFKVLDFKNYEVIVFQNYIRSTLNASPLLKEFITSNFDVEVNEMSSLFSLVVAETAMMLWHKDYVQQTKFKPQLLAILREYLVFTTSDLTPVPTNYQWYCIDQISSNVAREREDLILDFNEMFKENDNIKLKIMFRQPLTRIVKINNSDFLKKLSHLCLFGSVNYSSDFFRILFVNCYSLTTLQIIERSNIFPVQLLQYFRRSNSLKNFFIELRNINYFRLFPYLSECFTLENIHLVNSEVPVRDLPNPTALFRNCGGLYNICIKTDMYRNVRTNLRTLYENVKKDLNKSALNIDICKYTSNNVYSPYYNVFSMYKLRPV